MPRSHATALLHRLLAFSILLSLAACAGRAPGQPPPPARQAEAAALVRDSARALVELRAQSPRQILDHWLEDAKAVVVLPGVYQAGFLYSLHGGHGVVLARKTDGSWSPPAFVSVGGAGFGVQAGLERSRLVLVVLEDEALDQVLAGSLSFSTTAMFDVVGVREETGPDSRTRGKPVLAFADGVGLMAGVGMRGASLGQSRSLNAAYYGGAGGADKAGGAEILAGELIQGLEVLELWEALRVELPKDAIQRQ